MNTFPALDKQALVLLTTYSRKYFFFFFFHLRKVGHAYDEDFHTSVPMTKCHSILSFGYLCQTFDMQHILTLYHLYVKSITA